MFLLLWEIRLWQWFQMMFPRTVPLLVTAQIKGTFQDDHLHQKGHACAGGHPCECWMSLSGRMVAPVRIEIFVSGICEVCVSIIFASVELLLELPGS